MNRSSILLPCLAALALPAATPAQSLGTFRWQLQPYCNVVTVAVTQAGGVYRLEGTDDQCGGGRDLASVQGLAFPNPDGTIGFGLTIVTAPGGAPVHVDAEIALATLGGTWRDSTGTTGTFVFTPGAGTGGNPRPPAPPAIPPAFLLTPAGSFLATGAIGEGAAPTSGPGVRMMWHPGKAAFRAGRVTGSQWDDAESGTFSMAMGNDTVASGSISTAIGSRTTASSLSSTAMGDGTTASGQASTAIGAVTVARGFASLAAGNASQANGPISTAMGFQTAASGPQSTAMGQGTTAGGLGSTSTGINTSAAGKASLAGGELSTAAGDWSLAFGYQSRADGANSVALGRSALTTAAAAGAFVFADNSSPSPFGSSGPNGFNVRAAGGFQFYTDAAATLGATLAPNATAWSVLSDARTKEGFRTLEPEDVLARIAGMPVQEWNYIAQGPSIRHLGPTAQDFHAAFGLGEDPLRISTLDADGVALAGVKALEARTRELVRDRDEERRINEALRERLEQLERLLAGRR